MTDTLWTDEYERIGEDFARGAIDEAETRARMTMLGFDPAEIDDHIEQVKSND